jgi:hypothetical protein
VRSTLLRSGTIRLGYTSDEGSIFVVGELLRSKSRNANNSVGLCRESNAHASGLAHTRELSLSISAKEVAIACVED